METLTKSNLESSTQLKRNQETRVHAYSIKQSLDMLSIRKRVAKNKKIWHYKAVKSCIWFYVVLIARDRAGNSSAVFIKLSVACFEKVSVDLIVGKIRV